DAVPDHSPAWADAVSKFRYVCGNYSDLGAFNELAKVLDEVDRDCGTSGNRLYYLATLPSVFSVVADQLAAVGLNKPGPGGTFSRLVIEKPFGRDLDSAIALNHELHACFDESQIYRIDHYLGKETVQNVLALRFSNAIFEPVWNRRYVDHIQVTVAESIGVEQRGSFYETAGALRDIVQNHVMQVIGLILMEPPAQVDGHSIRDEKVKLLRSVEIMEPDKVDSFVVRGQYAKGWVDGQQVPSYREEAGVNSDSTTETYVAMKLMVDNWRWAGVPIYVRTGKRLERRLTEVALQFRKVPHLAFADRLSRELSPNCIVLRVQPEEGVSIRFGAKVPGQAFRVKTVSMDFSYGDAFSGETPDAYERLILDAMVGDPTLFIRADEVAQSWSIVDPILDAWEDEYATPVATYPSGTWGPTEADLLIERDQRRWLVL
ncbi:MAG TPA: glucose-6-phosphate dehydrogenase, partial [Acidimicrobiales bacterium]|nr:glucose-6-phosphate dehydrogenase [Acidimicrobiales bacterium]